MTDRIEKTIELRAPVERVWRALTDHNEFGTWFRVKIESPFKPGEVSRGHMTHPGYEHMKWLATVERMDAPKFFSFTWHSFPIDPDIDYSLETPTLVEFRLEPTANGTRLSVAESGFDAVPEHRRAEAFRMHEGGWEAQLGNIKAYVER